MPPDYSGRNLKGRSFKGQDLTGANFSGADIRSANFSGAKAGLQKRWAIFLVLISWAVAAVSGLFSAFFGYLAVLIFDTFNFYSVLKPHLKLTNLH
jgi:uncharacterized protein YjbI with pentapeptide repeats